MTQNKLTFESQKLNIDYLTFNVANSRQRIREFTLIFFNYGFNCKMVDLAKKTSQTILSDKDYKYTVSFRLEKDPWNKETTLIQFGGISSQYFYSLLTNESFSFSKFNFQNVTVGRIDINFIRKNQNDDSDLRDFFEKSKKVFENRYKNGIVQILDNFEEKTISLSLGLRSSKYFIRIYQLDSALKFEVEIKKTEAKDLGLLLLSNSFLEFEQLVTKKFFKSDYH